MRIVIKSIVLIVLVAGVWHARPLRAQQINFYPADPWVQGETDGQTIWPKATNHPDVLPPAPKGYGGLFTVPQQVVVDRGIFDTDSTSDAIAVPGHYRDDGATLLGNCIGDLKSAVNVGAAMGVPACLTQSCWDFCTKNQKTLEPAQKEVCDKACPKPQPSVCLAGCNVQYSIDEMDAITACYSDVVKFPDLKDKQVCFQKCKDDQGPASAGEKQCENACNKDPVCQAKCKIDAVANEKNCDTTCTTPKPKDQQCSDNCDNQYKAKTDQCPTDCKPVCGDPGDAKNNTAECWACKANCQKIANEANIKCQDICNDFGPSIALQKCLGGVDFAVINEKQTVCSNKCFTDQEAQFTYDQCQIFKPANDLACLSLLPLGDVETCINNAKVFPDGIPGSCQQPIENRVLFNDGDQDMGDIHLEDNWGPPGAVLINGVIPDPVDSVFPTITQSTDLMLPIAAVTGGFDGTKPDARQSIILNLFPLNKDAFQKLADLQKADPKAFMEQLLPTPLPAFLSNPAFQDTGPLFMTVRHDGSAPPVYDLQNECLTNVKSSPPNCRSMPIALQRLSLGGDTNAHDLAILHQYFASPPKPAPAAVDPGGGAKGMAPAGGFDPKQMVDTMLQMILETFKGLLGPIFPPSALGNPTALEYCSNVNEEGFLPGKHPENPSSQPINSNWMTLKMDFSTGSVVGQFATTQLVKSEVLGYLTAHKNDGSGKFTKQPNPETPYRFCVGKTPADLVTARLDGAKDGPSDLAVANFGGFSGMDPLQPQSLVSPSLEVAGGVTFVKDYQGGLNQAGLNQANAPGTQVLHLPIPATNGHFLHPTGMACGDINADGFDDCIVTGLDAMGLHLNIKNETLYQVPDVIGVAANKAPDFGGKCNGSPFADNKCPDQQGLAKYQGLAWFNDDKWSCKKVTAATNPANAAEAGNSKEYDLYECSGTSNDPTCGVAFTRKNATHFVYKVTYKINYTPLIQVPPDQAAKITGFPPQEWGCVEEKLEGPAAKVGVVFWKCNLPPSINEGGGLKSWKCSYTDLLSGDVNGLPVNGPDGLPDGDIFSCEGETVAGGGGVPALPVSLLNQLTFIDKKANVANITLKSPVGRDAVYGCPSQTTIDRESEFAVYMNRGAKSSPQGYNFPTSFGSEFPALHYVKMAQYNIPRIVPDFPVQFTSDGTAQAANNGKMMLTNKTSVQGTGGGNLMGLGVWPFHATLADLTDGDGAPKPDGCADAVIALNNSYYVALIPSQACRKDVAIQEPFTGAPVLFFDSTTPKYKADMEAFLNGLGPIALPQKLTGPDPLTPSEKMTLAVAMMSGTSYVTVPMEPVNDKNEFGEAETRRSIVAIHGFPWRVLIDSIDSTEFPLLGLVKGLLGDIQGKMGGGGAAGGCGGPQEGGEGQKDGGGGPGGCSLMPEAGVPETGGGRCLRGGL